MTFEDFLYSIVELKSQHPELRVGQAIMNILYDCNIDKYTDILWTEYDCFYIESLVPRTLKKLKEEWND